MPRILFSILVALLCGVGLAPFAVYLGTPLLLHLAGTWVLGLTFSLLVWLISPNDNALSIRVRGYVLGAILFRLTLLNALLILVQQQGMSIHGFFDDEFYETAWQFGEYVDERNLYVTLAALLGQNFGDYAALILRETNIVLSSMVAFPVALMLQRLGAGDRAARVAVLALLFLPYSAAHSIFAIKDVLSAMLLTSALWLIVELYATTSPRERGSAGILIRLAWLLAISAFLEGLRTGQGLATIVTALLALLVSKRMRIPTAFLVLLVPVILASVSIWTALNLEHYLLKADRYMRWIVTQVADGDFRAFFIVDSLTEVWKAPLAFTAYLLGPTPQPGLTGRVMIDAGGWLKLVDFPVLLAILAGLWPLRRKLWPFLLPVLVPILFSSIWNVSNFRAQLAYYPGLFVIFGLLLAESPDLTRTRIKRSFLATGLALAPLVIHIA